MARLLCVTSGLSGLLYTSAELARRLAAAGHEVVYASVEPARATIEGLGLRFEALPEDRRAEVRAADATRGLVTRWSERALRREALAEACGARAFARRVAELAPDLLLLDAELHELRIAASATGVPVALLNTFVATWRSPGLPPPHHLVTPGVGLAGSPLGLAALWLRLDARKRQRLWRNRLRDAGADRVAVLGLLAREVGFDLARETDTRQWPMPFTYRDQPVLCLHARELEFPHEPPQHVRFLGPLLLEERPDARITPQVRARLDALYAARAASSGARKLVYAGFGSFFSTDTAFLGRLLEAVGQRPDWDVVLSLGGKLEVGALGPLPANVTALPWVPQLEVLRHADVAVTHGAINTLDECVANGVPTLNYCGFATDMPGTTARAAYHGLGITGDRERDDAATIRSSIERLLAEPGFRERVAAIRERFEAYGRGGVAVREVEALLAGDASSAVPTGVGRG